MSSNLECRACNTELVHSSNVFFYIKTDTQIFPSIKPEKVLIVKSKGTILFTKNETSINTNTEPRSKKEMKRHKITTDSEKLSCANCKSNLGSYVPYGPNSCLFIAFKRESIILCGLLLQKSKSKKEKFHEIFKTVHQWKVIEQRTDDTFNGDSADLSSVKDETVPMPPPPSLYLPSMQDITRCSHNLCTEESVEGKKEKNEDLERNPEVNKLFAPPNIVKTIPRPYQIAAYLQALINDQIIVLPTGSGKTLIGTLLLVKLQILNPDRMGLFIVDRVPLVYQQGDYIIRETDGTLRVCMLCGQNITFSKIQELLSGHYDILVITAGCLVNLVQRKKIDFSRHFHSIVFDECHHACNNHPYCYLLNEINKIFDKPRVVGLTASPVSVASSTIKTQNRLEELRSKFGSNVGIYSPDHKNSKINNNDIQVEQVPISRSYLQKCFCCWVISCMENFRQIINKIIKMCVSLKLEDVLEEIPDWDAGIRNDNIVTDEDMFDTFCSAGSLGILRGKMNTLLVTLHYEDAIPDGMKLLLNRSLIPTMSGLVGAIEVIDILGPAFGSQVISELVLEDRFHHKTSNLSQDIYLLIGEAYRHLDEKSFDLYLPSPLSSRLKRLEHELQKIKSRSDEESRILILVRTRSIARDLYRYLCSKDEINNYMHPEICVGHGGYDGMCWEGEQEQALTKFKSSDKSASKLLIATSVLEEGLDVAACDLVIRFQGVTDVISFIQSRGRARRKGCSRLLIFTTDREIDHINKVRDGEIIMQKLIKLCRGLNYTLNDSMTRIEKELVNRIESYRKESIISDENNTKEPGKNLNLYDGILPPTTIWIPDKRRLDSNESFKECLQRSFEASGMHSILVKHIIPVESALLRNVFEHCCAYLVGLSYAGILVEEDDEDMFGEVLRKHWSYDVSSQMLWLQYESKYSPKEHPEFLKNEVTTISMGCWSGPNEFCEQSIKGKRIKDFSIIRMFFKERNSLWIILDTLIAIEISQISIHDFVLLDYADNNVTRMFFPLRSALHIYYMETIESKYWSPCIDFDMFPFLHDFTANDVLSLWFSSDVQPIKIRQIVRILNVPVFETKVVINEIVDISKISSNDLEFYSVEESRLIDPQIESLPSSQIDGYFSKVQDIHWMVQSIFCQRLGCFSSKIKTYIWNFVCTALDDVQDPKSIQFPSLLFALSKCLKIAYWADVTTIFMSAFQAAKDSIDDADVGNQTSSIFYRVISAAPDQNLFKLNNIIVTPTRILYQPAIFVKGCRLYRRFGSDHFLLCSFRNELLRHLHGIEFKDLITNMIHNGIITCGGQKYIFFGASQSQLREQKVLFINYAFIKQKSNSVKEICDLELFSKQIIHHSTEISTGRYLSNLALFCTADIPTISIGADEVIYKPDIRTRSEIPSTLTDGSGAICYSCAKLIALNYLKLKSIPAALQIRYRGVKGVLTVVQDSSSTLLPEKSFFQERHKKMMIRPSMIKCQVVELEKDVLCIVDYSKFYPMKLNREIVSLLSSINHKSFDPYPKLASLMENALEEEAQILANTKTGYISLSTQLNETTRTYYDGMFKHGDLTRCSLWIEMLQTQYKIRIRNLLQKTQIPLDNGCRLVGIPDPLGILQDGEIFVKIDSGNKQEILDCKNVLIWRNPCLHPGDVRIVSAVDKPLLHSWSNVIIFPCHENCLRNLALECSKGDTDGDQYYILWEDGLVPPRNSEVKPLVMNDGIKYPKKRKYHSNIHIADFIAEVFLKNCLGKISIMHLALSDHQKLGARDPLCCDLAMSHSNAVNFPKTGVEPLVSTKAEDILKQAGYPDFMEKNMSYSSKRPLGLLYKRAKLFYFDYLPVTHFGNDSDYYGKNSCPNSIDRRLLLPGRELFRHDAQRIHKLYLSAIEQVMNMYGLQSEAEILLSNAFTWDSLITNKGKAMDTIRMCFSFIQKQFHHLFQVLFRESSLLRQKQAASAWYEISLRNGNAKSFCITVSTVLHQILNDIAPTLHVSPADSSCRIGRAIESFVSKTVIKIKSQIKSRVAVADFVRQTILHRKSMLNISIFGSVSQALCSDESDLDLLIYTSAKNYNKEFASASKLSLTDYENLTLENRQRQFYDLFLYPSLDVISLSLEKVYNTHAPILRSQFNSGLISNCEGSSINIDLSCNLAGILKSQWLQMLFIDDAAIYITFLILMRWFRAIDSVKYKSSDTQSNMNILSVGECQALVLHMLRKELSNVKQRCLINWEKQYMTNRLFVEDLGFLENVVGNNQNLFSKLSAKRSGSLILAFFSNLSMCSTESSCDDILFNWPYPEQLVFDGKQNNIPGFDQPYYLQNQIGYKPLQILSHHCDAAKHFLLFCNDISSFLNFSLSEGEMCVLTQKLPMRLSYHIGTAQDFYSHHLALASGCNVQLLNIANEDNMLKIFAQGNSRCIMKLRKKLNELVLSLKSEVSTTRGASKYFMEESTGLWVYGFENAIVQLKFTDLKLVQNTARDIDSSILSGPYLKWNELSVCRVVDKAFVNNLHQHQTREEQICMNGEFFSFSTADSLAVQELDRVLSTQIKKMPDRHSFSGMKLSIGFGNFVVVNKNKWLPETRRSLSLKEVLEGMDKNVKSRKHWDRKEFCNQNQDVDKEQAEKNAAVDDQKTKNINGTKIENRATVRNKITKKKFVRKSQAKGITTTFIPTIDKVTFDGANSKEVNLQKKLEESFERCGYKHINNPWKDETNDKPNSNYYFVSLQISKSYEIKAGYYDNSSAEDDIPVAISVRERALNWVSFTLLGNGIVPDGRFRLRTYANVSEKLRDIADIDRSPILWENTSTPTTIPIPKFHPDMSKEKRKKIIFVGRPITEKWYEKTICGYVVRATITYEIQYWSECNNSDIWNHYPCYRIELDLSSALDELDTNSFNGKSIAFAMFLAYKELAMSLGPLMTINIMNAADS